MEIGYEKCEVASLDMDDFVEGKSYRLVVQRSPLKDKDGSRLRNLSPDPHSLGMSCPTHSLTATSMSSLPCLALPVLLLLLLP